MENKTEVKQHDHEKTCRSKHQIEQDTGLIHPMVVGTKLDRLCTAKVKGQTNHPGNRSTNSSMSYYTTHNRASKHDSQGTTRECDQK
jgi:hypothetical protein